MKDVLVAKVTFKIQQIAHVSVLGEVDKTPSNLPRVRKDDGLIGRLCAFMWGNNIYPVKDSIGAIFGGGMYIACYDIKDAAKIEAWLLKQGANRRKR